jgi:Carboxypeptidase regulatory-like domain
MGTDFFSLCKENRLMAQKTAWAYHKKQRFRSNLSLALAALLLSPHKALTEIICKEQHLKSVHFLCGSVINQLGQPILNSKVTVLFNGTEQAEVKTGSDGRFVFDSLKKGNYEIRIQADGYQVFSFPIALAKPSKQCKRTLQIRLTIGYPSCGGTIRLVKS